MSSVSCKENRTFSLGAIPGLGRVRQKPRGVDDFCSAQRTQEFDSVPCEIPHPRQEKLEDGAPALNGRAFRLHRCRMLRSAAYEMDDQRNHRENEQNVQRRSGDVEYSPAEDPSQQQQNEKNQEKHGGVSLQTSWIP